MKNTIKAELWKAFHNRMFYLALTIGAFIVAVDAAQNIEEVRYYTDITLWMVSEGLGIGGSSGFCVAMLSMFYSGVNFTSRLFLYLWPLIAAIPYGWSYLQERRNGVFNQIVSRTGARTYYAAKYIAVFCSGGAVISLTMLADLLINALICPFAVLSPVDMSGIVTNGHFLSELFYTHPWAHALIWCGVTFLLGGATACVCFFISSRLRLQALVVLFPFLFYIVLNYICQRIPTLWNSGYALSPLALILVNQYKFNPPEVVFSLLGVLLAVTFAVGYWRVVKHELD